MDEISEEAVANFVALTQCTPEQAHFFLEANAGDFDRAVSMFLGAGACGGGCSLWARATGGNVYGNVYTPNQGVAAPRVQPPPRASAVEVPPRPRPPGGGGGGGAVYVPRPPLPMRLVNTALGLPFAVVGGGLRLLLRTLGATVAMATEVARRVLSQPMANALAGAAHAITHGRDVEPASAAATFARAFASRYGDLHPLWQECGWQEAAARAHAEGKFLLVYLHAPDHQDTPRFCPSTLCDPDLVAYANRTFLCWGGDLRYSDAFRLSSSLGAVAYPYTALLAFSGPRTRLLTCVQGRMDPRTLLAVLRQAVADHSSLLWQEQAERAQRDHDRQLREEQDAEYQRSLEVDRERERRREEQRMQQEAAEREQREAEEHARTAAEAEQQRRADAAAALQRRKDEARQALLEEPAAGTPDTSLIRVRLPDGSNHQRRFFASDALEVVYRFVDSLETVQTLHFSLATTYPRRVLGADSRGSSLQELDLVPHAVLLVQPEDT